MLQHDQTKVTLRKKQIRSNIAIKKLHTKNLNVSIRTDIINKSQNNLLRNSCPIYYLV